jgi:hypothetical protein
MHPNGFAVLSVLALLGTASLVTLAMVAAVWGMTHHRRLLARLGLQLAAGLTGGYLIVLGLVGLLSQERVLPPGSEKYFCELDCHLAYSVERIHPLEAVESGERTMWAVRLRTRFDEQTISPTRGREAPLWPNPRRLALIDSSGRQYPPTEGLEPILARLGMSSTPLTRELRPGESYTTIVVFALPAGAVPAKLALQEDIFVDRFVIGHERSLFHAPVLLGLPVAG